jgi:hypothetical protein
VPFFAWSPLVDLKLRASVGGGLDLSLVHCVNRLSHVHVLSSKFVEAYYGVVPCHFFRLGQGHPLRTTHLSISPHLSYHLRLAWSGFSRLRPSCCACDGSLELEYQALLSACYARYNFNLTSTCSLYNLNSISTYKRVPSTYLLA